MPAFVLAATLIAAQPRLHVNLVLVPPRLRPRIMEPAIQEATDIWAKYGVELRVVDAPRREVGDDTVTLTVVIGARRDRLVPDDALGSVLFIDDSPQPVVRMYSDAIAALVDASSLPEYACHTSPLHDVVLGRVLGRALAHEIGHYLLRWRGHAQAGLMRARHSAIDLIVPERRAFALADDDVARLGSHIGGGGGRRHAPDLLPDR